MNKQVKLFEENSIYKLEGTINNFIIDKNIIDIKYNHFTYNIGADTSDNIWYTAMVVYYDK